MSDNPKTPFWKDSRFIISAIFIPILAAIIGTGFWQNAPEAAIVATATESSSGNISYQLTPVLEKPYRIVYQRRIKDNPDPTRDDYDLYIATLGEDGVWTSSLLIGGESTELFPSPSPDGEKIAFISDRSGNYDLWVIDVDGTDPIQLTDLREEDKDFEWSFASWTPDSKGIFFARDDGDYKIFQLSLSNVGVLGEPLIENGTALSPAVSPKTGRWIVYQTKPNREAPNTIWIYDLLDKTNTQLTFPEGEIEGNCQRLDTSTSGDIFPAWSPDETYIVFQRDRDICKLLISEDGMAIGNPIRLTSSERSDWVPTVSHDGKYIAYYHSGIDSIRIMDAVLGDSSIAGQITDLTTEGDDFSNTNPRWIP